MNALPGIARSMLLSACLLAPVVVAGNAHGLTDPSPADLLFVPGDRVPLSEFVNKNNLTATMHVDPRILTWLGPLSNVKVALRKSDGTIVTFNATSRNLTTGTVKLNATINGTCVVVSPMLTQHFPIVTHWRQDLHEDPAGQYTVDSVQYKGGRSEGAADAIRTLDLDVSEGELLPIGARIQNEDPLWGDASAGQYEYRSNNLALFDDGSDGFVNATVPTYEHYIGENFCVTKPTDLAAIWLSDQVRALTGFPISHRNFDAFSTGLAAEGPKPIFQVVHAYVVELANDSPLDGYENSLATFILPPWWAPPPANPPYPLLFASHYDVHDSGTFDWGLPAGRPGWGQTMFQTLGDLANQDPPRVAVGVFWNGGGAAGSPTVHRSAYENAAQLIQDAKVNAGADPEQVVFMGGSRGGIASLGMASNPYHHDNPADPLYYRARFVLSYTPTVRMGTTIFAASPSHPALLLQLPWSTGFIDCWRDSWTSPGGKTGRQLCMENLFNVTDHVTIDSAFSVDSAPFRQGLAAQETGVILRFGTHDGYRPYDQIVHYYDHLRDEGVPIQLDVYYRFGHQVPRDAYPTPTDIMNWVFDGASPLTTQVRHFQRDPADYTKGELIQPQPPYIPLTCEAPLQTGEVPQQHILTLVGAPGAQFQIIAYQSCNYGATPQITYGTLESSVPGAVFGTRTLSSTFLLGVWCYYIEYDYNADGNPDSSVKLFAPPPILPPFDQNPPAFIEVISNETIGYDVAGRTGGVSEY